MYRHICGNMARIKLVSWQVMGDDKNCEGMIFNNISIFFYLHFPPLEWGPNQERGDLMVEN